MHQGAPLYHNYRACRSSLTTRDTNYSSQDGENVGGFNTSRPYTPYYTRRGQGVVGNLSTLAFLFSVNMAGVRFYFGFVRVLSHFGFCALLRPLVWLGRASRKLAVAHSGCSQDSRMDMFRG